MTTTTSEAGPAATRHSPRPDRAYTAALLVLALAVHLWLLAHTAATARDTVAFARVALRFDDPNAGRPPGGPRQSVLDVIREAEHPPGYPLAVWLASVPVRAATAAPLADQFLLGRPGSPA